MTMLRFEPPPIAQVLPADVVWCLRLISEACAEPDPLEAQAVSRAVPKRRKEFAVGRHCAREALGQLMASPADFPGTYRGAIPAGPDRAPIWPAGVVGSITHNDHFCAAAVAHRPVIAALGIDIDSIARFDTSLEATVCTPFEIDEWLLPADPPERQRRLAAIFSVKEAFYKAQYALTQAWLDFEDVQVTHMGPLGAKGATAGLVVIGLGKTSSAGSTVNVAAALRPFGMTIRCALDRDHVVSAVVLRS